MKKGSKYSIYSPIIRMSVAKKEKEIGRKLNKDEKDKFVNKEKRKLRRGARIAGIFAAVGITLGVAATKLPQLPEGKNVKTQEQTLDENRKSKNEEFRSSMQVNVKQTDFKEKENENDNNIIKEVIEKYNSQYNEMLEQKDIGFIQSKPQYLITDNDDNIVFDYKQKTEYKDIIENEYNTDTVYIIVNKNKKEIISAIGNVNNEIVNIRAKQAKVDNIEYIESDKTIKLIDDKDKNKNKEIFDSIENTYEKYINDGERE